VLHAVPVAMGSYREEQRVIVLETIT